VLKRRVPLRLQSRSRSKSKSRSRKKRKISHSDYFQYIQINIRRMTTWKKILKMTKVRMTIRLAMSRIRKPSSKKSSRQPTLSTITKPLNNNS